MTNNKVPFYPIAVAVRKRHQRQDDILIFFYPHLTGISKVVFLSLTQVFITKCMLCEMCALTASAQAYVVQTGWY